MARHGRPWPWLVMATRGLAWLAMVKRERVKKLWSNVFIFGSMNILHHGSVIESHEKADSSNGCLSCKELEDKENSMTPHRKVTIFSCAHSEPPTADHFTPPPHRYYRRRQ